MPIPFAINGLGRIGRALLRIAADREDIECVAINDLAPLERIAPLLRRDSVHGRFEHPVEIDDGKLFVAGRRIDAFSEDELGAVPWGESEEGAPLVVVEATGVADTREEAAAHLGSDGADPRFVVVSANLRGADVTICLGVNDDDLDPEAHRVVSNASCTTNCMAPVALVLHRRFGLARGLLTTVHAYTATQRLLDSAHKDPRRARAAALNLVPTSTGAARAVGLVLPELGDRLDAQAVRVPTADVSMVQFIVELEGEPTIEEVAQSFREAAEGDLAGILSVTDEELVSTDFIGDPHSAIVDLPLLQAIDDRLFRVVAWYDNEWGYATRVADLVATIGERA